MNVHQFTDQFDIAEWLAAVSRNAGNADSASIDLTKYTNAEITVLVSLGNVGAAGTLEVKFQESDDDSTFTDLAGSGASTGVLSSVQAVTLARRPRSFTKRYARLRAVVGVNAVVASATRIAQKSNPTAL